MLASPADRCIGVASAKGQLLRIRPQQAQAGIQAGSDTDRVNRDRILCGSGKCVESQRGGRSEGALHGLAVPDDAPLCQRQAGQGQDNQDEDSEMDQNFL
jgi:hypothetical protein